MNNILELSGPFSEPKSGKKAKQLVILLHGLGADGSDLHGLAPYFADVMPDAYFIAPDAPFACDMAPYGKQWFSLIDRQEEAILSGLTQAEPILNLFIDQQMQKLALAPKDVALVGFSQGSMLSLHTALRREEPLAGLLAYSGALVAPARLEAELKSKLPVCLVHGEADEVVPFEAFNEALANLQKVGVYVNGYSQQELGHGIDPAGLKIGQEFMKEIFGL